MNTTQVGASARRSRTVTRQDIALFTEISGDRNPIHYDEDLAAASRFGGVVVQGGVTSGLLNALVAEQLPGPGSVFLEVAWRFLAPVRPGDVITAQATVTALRDDKPVTTLATQVVNQAGVRFSTAPPSSGATLSSPASRMPTTHTSPPDLRRHHRKGTRMTTTTENPRTNGVDTATLFATLDAVKEQPEIAKFQFRASNEWLGGTHSRSTLLRVPRSAAGDGTQASHHRRLRPPGGPDRPGRGPDPRRVSAARHRRLPDRRHRQHRCGARRPAQQGQLDRRGRHRPARHPRPLGGDVRNGYEQIKVTLHIEGDADEATLRGIVEQSRRRSAVYDVLTNPTPVAIEVVTG